MSGFAKATALIVGIPAGAFLLLVVYFIIFPDKTPPAERIAQECQREFGAMGEQAVSECRIRLITRRLREIERDKLDSAYGRSR